MYANSLFSSQNVFGFSSSFFFSSAVGAGVWAHAVTVLPSTAIRAAASQPRVVLIVTTSLEEVSVACARSGTAAVRSIAGDFQVSRIHAISMPAR